MVRPPISWPGNKRLLAPRIIERLPPHRCYAEVFGGSLAVLLAKPPSIVEIVNDLDAQIVNFFRCARHHCGELQREMALVLHSRSEFESFLEQPGLTDIQRAARWHARNKLSFGGKGRHYATSKLRGGGIP